MLSSAFGGGVSIAKISVMVEECSTQYCDGSAPSSLHTVWLNTPSGRLNSWGGYHCTATSITPRQIGPAPVTPVTLTIGVLSVLPTHTPTAISDVKPIVQLSRKSLVVPVLAPAG